MINGWQTCCDCGAEFYRKGPRQVRCRKCQKKHEQKLAADRKEKKKAEKLAAEAIDDKDAALEQALAEKEIETYYGDTKCRRSDCVYSMQFSGGCHACGYIIINEKQRPCSVKKCTEYKKKGKRKKRGIVINAERYAKLVEKGGFTPEKKWEE